MKKIIPGILATAMSFACFAACGETKPTPVDMSGVKGYVDRFFAGQHAETNADYELSNATFYDGKEYKLEWSLETVEGVTLTVSEDGKKTLVDVNEITPVAIEYVLNVKISDDKGNSTTTSFNRTVLACDPYVLAPITATPVEDTIYKLWVFQGATGQNCYVNGNMKNTHYFETVEDPDEALDLYVEFKEGSTTEFYIYYNKEVKAEEEEGTTATEATAEENTETAETVKTYITLYQSGTHTNAKYWTLEEIRKETNDTTAMPVAYVYNTEYGTITTEFGGATWYFGCDGTYTTVEPQKETGSGYYKGYLTTLTDRTTITTERKFESEKNNFNFAPVYVDAQDIDVTLRGSTYPDVKISWNVTGDGATFEGTTISLNAGEATSEIKVKATFTVGSGENKETSEKEWTFKLIPNTAEAIFAALAGLTEGQKFGNSSASMTGVITKIDTPFDDQYGNITFTMAVGENSIYCYRVKGSGADELQVGDTVTVAGGMENYRGTPQFSSGCALIEYTFGPDHKDEPDTPVTPDTPDVTDGAILDMMGTTNLKSRTADKTIYEANGITYTNDKASSTTDNYDQKGTYAARAYQGSTITIESTSAFKAIVFTLDDYNSGDYLKGFEGMTIAGATITRANDVVTIVFAEAVTTFTTANLVSQVRIEKIEIFAEAPSTDTPDTPVTPDPEPEEPSTGALTMVTAPEVGKAYHFAFERSDGSKWYFAGTLDSQGYYLQATDSFEKSVQVYLKAQGTVANAYYLCFMNGTTESYIEIYKSGTHINVRIVTAAPATYYTFNTEYNTLVSEVEGTVCFLGSRNTYQTISGGDYDKYVTTNYKACFYTEGTGTDTPDTPVTPDTPDTPVTPDPEGPEVTTTNKADFDTLTNSGQYKTGLKTTSGWSVDYCAVLAGGATSANPVLPDLLGSDSNTKGVCLVGKTSAPGKVTSCVLSGGISKLSFEYGLAFTDTQFSITISIKSADGSTVLASNTLTQTGWKKYQKGTFVWELEEEIQGDFIIEIVNNCLSEQDSNKDRVAVWNLTWENATSKENA